jgi:hypothetical protein
VVLSATTIYGKAHASRAMERLAGFLHRKRVEWGHFITREDIERRQPFNTTDLFQAMLGVRIIRSGFDYSIMMQGIGGYWCTPKVFLDGFSFPLNGGGGTGNVLDSFIVPEDLAAVEVYPRNMLTPAQFRDVNDCGSIVLWSRYAFPYVKIER